MQIQILENNTNRYNSTKFREGLFMETAGTIFPIILWVVIIGAVFWGIVKLFKKKA